MLLNLLMNACDAVYSGGTIKLVGRARGAKIEELVEDDGIGIAEEDLSLVFELFFSRKSAGNGTGLGLSICRRIISEHNGEIKVSSASGAGTEGEVRLPAVGMGVG